MEMKSAELVRNAEERKAFYARIDGDHLAPLWEVLKGLVPAEPKPAAAPHLWDYDAIRPRILFASLASKNAIKSAAHGCRSAAIDTATVAGSRGIGLFRST